MNKFLLDTPCLVIDQAKLTKNLELMQREVESFGKQLRPHVKTHKCSQLAKLQIAKGAAGVCVTKVGELEVLCKAGVSHILVTSPVVTEQKISRLIACIQREPSTMVVTDSVANVEALQRAAAAVGAELNVLVDVDPWVGRTGVSYEDALSLGQRVQRQSNLRLIGVQCYAGNLQHISSYEERLARSHEVLNKAAEVVQQFCKAGLRCDILTGAGTGTYAIDSEIAEITEVQPGSYAVMDMEYRLIGSKEDSQRYDKFLPAMTMLVTVISANHDTHVTVDAGTKSLYFDPQTKPEIISHMGLHYDWSVFGDEHGKVTADPGVVLPKIGDVLELIVPHCDPTINLFDRFYLTDNDELVEEWEIDLRGQVK